ncbi:MAG: pyridoxamine 5'-phosphate oxidase family protein [Methanotrichaceae archaeon]
MKMVKMPTEVRETLEKQRILPIATATADGKPNVVYIGTLKILDDETLALADNFFKKTEANLEQNPWVSIVCWDKEVRKSFQIKGKAIFHDEGEIYDNMVTHVHKLNDKIKMRRAVTIKIEEIYDAQSGPNAGNRIA